MKEKIAEELLIKADIETIKSVKKEGGKNLLGLQEAIDVVVNKSNNLLQILIPVIIVLIGFVVNGISVKSFDWKFHMSIMILFLFCIVVFFLYKNIIPVLTAVPGVEPKKLVNPDFIVGNKEKEIRNILANRIVSLQNAIDLSLEVHSNRIKNFKIVNKLLLFGLAIILLLFLLVFLSGLLFQRMCSYLLAVTYFVDYNLCHYSEIGFDYYQVLLT